MTGLDLRFFREVWFVDFEFVARPGERQQPLCLVARRLGGPTIRLWEDELRTRPAPPYPVDPGSLIVAYYASAEMGCHLALGWPLPERVLDLYAEFRVATNGRSTPCGSGLLGALVFHGLQSMEIVEKEEMRTLAMRGGPYSAEERRSLLDYCEADVDALARLLPRMLPGLDLPRAVLRGRYMRAAAAMEHRGVPVDRAALGRLLASWGYVQEHLVEQVDRDYGVFEGRAFRAERWADWLAGRRIPWPRLDSGALALDDDTFRQMAKTHPEVAPMRELRHTLSQLRLADLTVGADGRNRCLLSAFRARSGRNQPSNSRFIFGPSTWLRGLIRPEPGWGLAYVDWSQQEFGIAAALSGDTAMLNAYRSGDPYLAFAKQAGAAPPEATKESHATVRELFKACVLAVQYCMGEDSLAYRTGRSLMEARELLRLHRQTYRTFWSWSDSAVATAMLHGRITTVFGWPMHAGGTTNPRSLRNFPMQANGAEMLRLACSLAIERGVGVCAPVHDAVLVEAPLEQLAAAVTSTQEAMAEASQVVLGGLRLGTDAKLVLYPDRYMDKRGARMWDDVWRLVEAGERSSAAAEDVAPVHHRDVAPVHQGCRTGAHPSHLLSPLLSLIG